MKERDVRIARELFVEAYKFYYGGTRKAALKAWDEYDDARRMRTIKSYRKVAAYKVQAKLLGLI